MAHDEPQGRLPRASTLESWPDHQSLAGGLNDLFRDCLQLVNLEDALDFGAEAMQQAEVATGDTDNRRDGFGISKVAIRVGHAQMRPSLRQDMPRLIGTQGPEGMHKAHPRVQLRVGPNPTFVSRATLGQVLGSLSPNAK